MGASRPASAGAGPGFSLQSFLRGYPRKKGFPLQSLALSDTAHAVALPLRGLLKTWRYAIPRVLYLERSLFKAL